MLTDEDLAATKVTGGDGKPLVVYHGTTKVFDKFSTAPLQSLGLHFGNLVQAEHFAGTGEGARIIPAFLIIKSPVDIRGTDAGFLHPKLTALTLRSKFYLSFDETVMIIDSENHSMWEHRDIEAPDVREKRNARIMAVLKAKGFDGIFYSNRNEPPDGIARDAYAVFHTQQVFSAITRECLGSVE